MKQYLDKTSYKISEALTPTRDTKRPGTSYLSPDIPSYSHTTDGSFFKTIEESKQNRYTLKKDYFTSSAANFHQTGKKYMNQQEKSHLDSTFLRGTMDVGKATRTKTAKKTCFADFRYQQSKDYQYSDQPKHYFQKKDRFQNPKNGRMDDLYKTTDLRTNRSNHKLTTNKHIQMYQDIERKIKQSKSLRKLKVQTQEPRRNIGQNEYKKQFTPWTCAKSSKKIQEMSDSSDNFFSKSSKKLTFNTFPEPKTQTNCINDYVISPKKSYKQIKQEIAAVRSPTKSRTCIQAPIQKKYYQKPIQKEPSLKKQPISRKKLSIDDFQLGSCKGQGAFGQVFPGVHKATRMLVAIKKIPKQKVKYMLDQFINEIKIQMYLNHQNIVQLYGFFDDHTHFYIIMQYMQGGSLYSLLKKQKKFTKQETVQKLKEICCGLKEMHDNSILHRDIKPENIVMTNGVSKLCDFGWSAICKDRRTTYCGTLDYVSPQIIQGQGYDDSVDIWCIGVLAYQMICGKAPFYNISKKETMKNIVNVTYQYPPELTGNAKIFIDSILKKNAEERMGIDEVLKAKFLT